MNLWMIPESCASVTVKTRAVRHEGIAVPRLRKRQQLPGAPRQMPSSSRPARSGSVDADHNTPRALLEARSSFVTSANDGNGLSRAATAAGQPRKKGPCPASLTYEGTHSGRRSLEQANHTGPEWISLVRPTRDHRSATRA